ncbi:Receptor-type tyrosine-protein phosphatase gamma [Labeo rohita]|uniref:Receptor-type tyrosine-protein phosphatase gamma n=1 Tax=Labeo rohita TaxID=84645 RepID=A0ABQ8M8P0_LABRO|nr:Receptor-type tyrosine-protein phosphatase gamma [Labeo rohita]
MRRPSEGICLLCVPEKWSSPLAFSLFNPLSFSLHLTVAIFLKDDYFVRGAGLPGRFKAEKVEFHWGQSNGSDGSEHSINGRRFPVEVSFN